jgi:hypothetical protein
MSNLSFRRTCALALLAAPLATACSNEVDTGAGGTTATASATSVTNATATGSTHSSTVAIASSSSTGGNPVCPATTDTVFAIQELFFGDADVNGVPSPTAWEVFGFNIDGLVSTSTSTDVCQPANNASKSQVYPDGNNGNDNSFGKNIIPVILGVDPSLSTQGNLPIQTGVETVLIKLDALGAGTDQSNVVAKIYDGASIGSVPKFDGSDCWPVTPSSLTTATDVETAKIQFPASTLVANHWDSNGNVILTIPVAVMGYTLLLNLHDAHISMDLDAAHQHVVGGQIGGVIDTAELQNQFKQLAGSISQQLCTGAVVQSILNQIAQASDIMNDGTQDPALTCNGVSVGLGFKASRVDFGAIGADPSAPTMPCP